LTRHARLPGAERRRRRRPVRLPRSSGKRRLLAKGYDDGLETSGLYDRVRTAGRFVAWQYTETDLSCKADCPPGYDPTTVHSTIRDLRSGKARKVSGDVGDDGRLVLTAGGAIAWSEDDPFAIKAFDAAGARTLDEGDNLSLRSLRLRDGNRAVWRNGAENHSERLAAF
jgi:hypothetical protein